MSTNFSDTDRSRDHNVQRVIIIEGSANFIVLLAKLWVGISTGSLAILGDAIHSLTDVTNNVVAWVVIRLSILPPDREHPYGHRKFETLAVFFLASLLAVLAFELALRAISKEEVAIVSSSLELGIMLGVLLVNISLASWERLWATRLKSDILIADASHTFADVLTTIVIIIGWQLSAMGFLWLDRACALGVAGLIFYLAFNLYKKAMPVLVDEFAIDPDLISSMILNIRGVKQVNRVRSRWIGTAKAIDIIISVEPSLTTDDSHNIASEIEALIDSKFGVSDISIHVEPFR
ncbi:MAG: cation diffusion facilitator family transporter [Gammaproteobacteria bacterium]|nr:cation diffusion facilitator family transporter [Gammaproteobacteria bacterium]